MTIRVVQHALSLYVEESTLDLQSFVSTLGTTNPQPTPCDETLSTALRAFYALFIKGYTGSNPCP